MHHILKTRCREINLISLICHMQFIAMTNIHDLWSVVSYVEVKDREQIEKVTSSFVFTFI